MNRDEFESVCLKLRRNETAQQLTFRERTNAGERSFPNQLHKEMARRRRAVLDRQAEAQQKMCVKKKSFPRWTELADLATTICAAQSIAIETRIGEQRRGTISRIRLLESDEC